MREQLRPILARAQKLILDMTRVDYLSSAGLRLLLLTYREVTAARGKVVLLGVSREIQTVMSHTGFLSFFSSVRFAGESQAGARVSPSKWKPVSIITRLMNAVGSGFGRGTCSLSAQLS